jgi:ACT domain-containing protein
MDFMSKVIEAVKEASISVACLLDDVAVNEDDILNGELDLNVLQKDIEHLQDQITSIENNIKKYHFISEEKSNDL